MRHRQFVVAMHKLKAFLADANKNVIIFENSSN
jgi:hypothetical protein